MTSSADSNIAYEIEDVEGDENEDCYLYSNDDEEEDQPVDEEEELQEEKDEEIDEQQQQYSKTLLSELLDQYEDMKKSSSKLPSRKAIRLTSRAIGISSSVIIN